MIETEILAPVAAAAVPEAERFEAEEVIRRARMPIIKEGFTAGLKVDDELFDPGRVGWEEAAQNVLAQIEAMQSSGLVQLSGEGLSPEQLAKRADEARKLAEAGEAVEQARLAAERLAELWAAAGKSEKSPQQTWEGKSDEEKNTELGEWYRRWQEGEEPEEWQKELLRQYNLWGGGESPRPTAAEPTAEEVAVENMIIPEEEERAAEGLAVSVGEGSKKIQEFLKSEKGQKILMGVEFVAGGALGFILGDILKLGPGQEMAMAIAAQSGLGLMALGSGIGARAVEKAEARFPRFARLSQRLAGEKGLAGVLRNIRNAAGRIWSDPIVVGATLGVMSHSIYEMLSGQASIIPGARAVEPAAETSSATGTGSGGGTPQSPDVQVPGAVEGSSPPAGEQPQPQHPGAGRLPGGETAGIPAEDLAAQPGDVALEAQRMAELAEQARQAALEEATRVHAVNPNDTLSAIVSHYGGDAYGIDMTNTVVQSAGELTGGTDLAGNLRPGTEAAKALVEYLKVNPTVTWRQAINEGLKTATGESVAKLFADATRMIYPNKLLNVVVGAGV